LDVEFHKHEFLLSFLSYLTRDRSDLIDNVLVPTLASFLKILGLTVTMTNHSLALISN